jgi:hypothetical protein
MSKLRSHAANDNGFALVIALALIMTMSAIVLPFLTSARIEALIVRNEGRGSQDKFLLQGLIEFAAHRYFEVQGRDASAAIRSVSCPLAEGTMILAFQDHKGLIDLMNAPEPLLAAGFEASGLPASTISPMTRAVLELRETAISDTPAAGSLLAPPFERAPEPSTSVQCPINCKR